VPAFEPRPAPSSRAADTPCGAAESTATRGSTAAGRQRRFQRREACRHTPAPGARRCVAHRRPGCRHRRGQRQVRVCRRSGAAFTGHVTGAAEDDDRAVFRSYRLRCRCRGVTGNPALSAAGPEFGAVGERVDRRHAERSLDDVDADLVVGGRAGDDGGLDAELLAQQRTPPQEATGSLAHSTTQESDSRIASSRRIASTP
jgi:hypothetical protein